MIARTNMTEVVHIVHLFTHPSFHLPKIHIIADNPTIFVAPSQSSRVEINLRSGRVRRQRKNFS